MATKAVTLKNSNDDTVYPVTDVSLVNGGIFADTIAPVEAGEQITTNMIADGAVTADKINWTTFGKASVAVLTASTGSFTALSKGVLIVDSQFQASAGNTDAKATITFTGASGGTFSPRGAQYGAQYTRSHAFGFAFVEAGDEVDFTVNYTSASLPAWGADNGFALFLPCEW